MPSRFRRWRPKLRPRAGRRLPRELRPGRVADLARRLAEGVRDPELEVLLRRIDTAPIHTANEAEVYFDGAHAFAAMCDAIAAARQEVLVESYIVRDDATGRQLLEVLGEAAGRGVAVKVLADALGSFRTPRAFWREMRRRGVEVRLFHPLFPYLWWQLFRDHRKILVADREVGFTGGMNIGEEYGSSHPRPGQAWRDTHVRVQGSTAWEMAVVFSEGWRRAGGSALGIPPLEVSEDDDGGGRVLVLDSRPNRGHAESAAALAALVGAARRTVWITNAYFAPGHTAARVLAAAVRRGVDVRLLLPGKTDAPLVRHCGHGYFRWLLRAGIRIFEYQAAILHAKAMVADEHASVVGSSNLDFRSFQWNAECNLVILDSEIGRRMAEAFLRDLDSSREIRLAEWGSRPRLHRLGDRAARWLAPLL